MTIKIFADVGGWTDLENYNNDPDISGFTTNPSLLRKGGVTDYLDFAQRAAALVHPKPISFEVFANSEYEIYNQGLRLRKLNDNIYVKVPILLPPGGVPSECFNWLTHDNVNINITGVLTTQQLVLLESLSRFPANKIISIFAGRIADTGQDPVEVVRFAKLLFLGCPDIEILWASTRELYNIKQAEACGCDIITVTPDILAKRYLIGKNLAQYSLETIQQFHKDAEEAGFTI